MPRQARKISESGIYHIILRGINKQTIFEDEEDNNFFLSVLLEYKEISGYKLFSYCLMGNHAHLLIKVENEPLDKIIRRIAGKYVFWYNNKYQRIGHLFQDRYKSEPVDTDAYLLSVIRYIHQNPLKANLEKTIGNYPYSSYNDYIKNNKSSLIDTEFVLSIISKPDFVKYHEEKNNDICIEITEKTFYLTDEQAKKVVQKIAKCSSATDIQQFDADKRNEIIKELKKHGLSIRQISRLTGISKAIIERL